MTSLRDVYDESLRDRRTLRFVVLATVLLIAANSALLGADLPWHFVALYLIGRALYLIVAAYQGRYGSAA